MAVWVIHLLISGHDRRTAPKFGTHVRIDTLTLKKNLTHPTPGGFRGLYIVKKNSRWIAPKFGTHVRIDTLTLKKKKKFDPPHPRGFRGLYIVKNLSRRRAPKFGTHVRIDTLTLKKKYLTHPTPGGFRGLNCLARLALARERTPSVLNKKPTSGVLINDITDHFPVVYTM